MNDTAKPRRTTTRKAKPLSVADITDKAGQLPESLLLGRLVVFTITDERVAHDDVTRWFDELNLAKDRLPAPNKAVDAFKKATSEVRDEYDLSSGEHATLMCREVTTTSELIQRSIVREVRDGKRRRLAYTGNAIEAVFYKAKVVKGRTQQGSEALRLTVAAAEDLLPGEHTRLKAIAREIEQHFHVYADLMDGNKLRAMVRDYVLKQLDAIQIKAGFYFVLSQHADELLRLQSLVNRLGGGCKMHLIPLVRLEDQRDMVIEAFQREAADTMDEIIKEVAELRASRQKITADAYAKIKARYDASVAQARTYVQSLQISNDTTKAAADLAMASVTALQKQWLDQQGGTTS